MKKQEIVFYKVIKITAGKLHCWVQTNFGLIKKEIKNVPQVLMGRFYNEILSQ